LNTPLPKDKGRELKSKDNKPHVSSLGQMTYYLGAYLIQCYNFPSEILHATLLKTFPYLM